TGSITDSPTGDYADNATSSISTIADLDLTDALSAQMVYWGRWEIETNFDYAQAQVSVDNGLSWSPLCGHHTKSGNAFQDFGAPLYDSYKLGWLKEELSLDNYIGMNVKVGFQIVADNGGTADGFYFDDLRVEKLVPFGVGIMEQANPGIGLSQNMPNPADEYTYINYSVDGNEKGVLKVFNAFGQLVFSEQLNDSNGSCKLTTAGLAQGLYYYSLATSKGNSESFRMTVIR
ncbi:MAG: immune inhibitor A, partial [Bacteroidota bacterium]|nr:immune inhibitor A [Bacteroidota bacterium]